MNHKLDFVASTSEEIRTVLLAFRLVLTDAAKPTTMLTTARTKTFVKLEGINAKEKRAETLDPQVK